MRRLLVMGMVAALAVFSVFYFMNREQQQQALEQAALNRATSDNGFVELSTKVVGEGIVIMAPMNCTSQQARAADDLAAALRAEGIAFRRTNSLSLSLEATEENRRLLLRLDQVMDQPPPMVFVHGRAKSNPSFEEVVAEFRGR
ncbi:hypothetical protein CUZ56_01776 [Saezia sanguinis]|uniref:Uncharacterized protein n=1 Tax=Saezia sanguinis TaxID=1965230 RepID=A0A433SCT8_9BURK|nr:hypothetical protein [Saezia sanguinis]RUS66496.1 hypothetical protein CUZ56_01776 [Saezia sanguinis]